MAITQTLTQFPVAPNIALQEPEVFSARCDDTFAAQITFVPEMTEVISQINVEIDNINNSADLAKDWATKLTTEVVTGQGYSAKQYAINAGESSTSAQAWAVQLTTPVSGSDYSAKQYALNAGTSAALAQNWATQASGEVIAGQGYSAKYYANNADTSATNADDSKNKAEAWAENPVDVEVEIGAYSALHWSSKSSGYAANASNSATLAQAWAVQLDNEVEEGEGYSAKQYAINAEYWAGQAQLISGIDTVINDSETNSIQTWSSQKLSSISTNADLITSDNNTTASYIEDLFDGI